MASIGPNELFFLLQGLKWTLALTIIGFIGGGVFGLCVALARVADSPAIQRASHRLHRRFPGHAAPDAAFRGLLRRGACGL
ncbi:Amino acid ABC transporter permease [Agrobacterium tumefaciens]|nr:Amino acid ABC transporter permease [Agrobacterium tumefaciens]